MIKLVDRYVGKSALLGLLTVWVVLVLLFIAFSSLAEFRSIQNDYGFGDVAWYVALTTPRMAYQVFPVSALLGTLVGVGALASANELVAFRTSGVSRMRLSLAALTGTLMITIPVMIMGEWIAPLTEQEARAFRLSERGGQAIIGGTNGVWIRDGADFVNIRKPLLSGDRGEQSVSFHKVAIYSLSESGDLETITRANTAVNNDEGWRLEDVSTVRFGEEGANNVFSDRKGWRTDIEPDLIDSAVTRPALLSLRSLWKHIVFLHENRLDNDAYQVAFWRKIIFPFTAMALVLAGMPFVFGHGRTQNMGVRLFLGMLLGGLFIVFEKMSQQIGGFYNVQIWISSTLPPLTLAIASIFILRKSV